MEGMPDAVLQSIDGRVAIDTNKVKIITLDAALCFIAFSHRFSSRCIAHLGT